LKVLLVNKFFFPFGGSETSFFQTAELLQGLGHEVIYFSMDHPRNLESPFAPYFASRIDFEEMNGWRAKFNGAARVLFGREPRARLRQLLRSEKPDIAHLHNIYHHLSPAIIGTIKGHGIPVVMTLHDYKAVCPAYKLFRAGTICERCRGGRFHWCFLQKCVKDSYMKSLVCALEMRLQRKYYRQVDRYIAPSRFMESKAAEMGLAGKCAHIANFTASASAAASPEPGAPVPQVIYFGRLVEEKGVALLIEAMTGVAADCLIVGDGPLKSGLQALARQRPGAQVRFLPHQPLADLRRLVRASSMAVVPSVWYENNPFAIIESFALGVPVVAARIGGIPELVSDGETGLLFPAGDATVLQEKIYLLLAEPALGRQLAANARLRLRHDLSPQRHAEKLLALYRELLGPDDGTRGI
jgi:glycosyltransferase involved in cell wall biosynthesis